MTPLRVGEQVVYYPAASDRVNKIIGDGETAVRHVAWIAHIDPDTRKVNLMVIDSLGVPYFAVRVQFHTERKGLPEYGGWCEREKNGAVFVVDAVKVDMPPSGESVGTPPTPLTK